MNINFSEMSLQIYPNQFIDKKFLHTPTIKEPSCKNYHPEKNRSKPLSFKRSAALSVQFKKAEFEPTKIENRFTKEGQLYLGRKKTIDFLTTFHISQSIFKAQKVKEKQLNDLKNLLESDKIPEKPEIIELIVPEEIVNENDVQNNRLAMKHYDIDKNLKAKLAQSKKVFHELNAFVARGGIILNSKSEFDERTYLENMTYKYYGIDYLNTNKLRKIMDDSAGPTKSKYVPWTSKGDLFRKLPDKKNINENNDALENSRDRPIGCENIMNYDDLTDDYKINYQESIENIKDGFIFHQTSAREPSGLNLDKETVLRKSCSLLFKVSNPKKNMRQFLKSSLSGKDQYIKNEENLLNSAKTKDSQKYDRNETYFSASSENKDSTTLPSSPVDMAIFSSKNSRYHSKKNSAILLSRIESNQDDYTRISSRKKSESLVSTITPKTSTFIGDGRLSVSSTKNITRQTINSPIPKDFPMVHSKIGSPHSTKSIDDFSELMSVPGKKKHRNELSLGEKVKKLDLICEEFLTTEQKFTRQFCKKEQAIKNKYNSLSKKLNEETIRDNDLLRNL